MCWVFCDCLDTGATDRLSFWRIPGALLARSQEETSQHCWAAGNRYRVQEDGPPTGETHGFNWAFSRAAFYTSSSAQRGNGRVKPQKRAMADIPARRAA